jgi:hypothetical protein
MRYVARAGSVSDGFTRFNEDESSRESSSLTLPALRQKRHLHISEFGFIEYCEACDLGSNTEGGLGVPAFSEKRLFQAILPLGNRFQDFWEEVSNSFVIHDEATQ